MKGKGKTVIKASTNSESGKHSWYETISPEDRLVVDAVAKWLRPVCWQWFVTLTFPWNVKSETADLKLRDWINAIERELRTRMCFVYGKEHKPRTHGMECPWHFHLLATATTKMPQSLLERAWKARVGPGSRRVVDGLVLEDSILVEPYQTDLKGPEYCLKNIGDCDGDWRFRWLELFNPAIPGTSKPDHRSVRQRKRFRAAEPTASR